MATITRAASMKLRNQKTDSIIKHFIGLITPYISLLICLSCLFAGAVHAFGDSVLSREWDEIWGENGQGDAAYGIALDGDGNIYVGGYAKAYSTHNTNYLAKIQMSDHSILWTNTWGGGDAFVGEGVRGVAVDPSISKTYSVGSTYRFVGGSWKPRQELTSYSSDGNTKVNRVWGNDYDNSVNGVAFDANNSVCYVVATTFGSIDGQGGMNGTDICLSKFDAGLTRAWSKILGGGFGEYGTGVAVDGAGNVYVVGYSDSLFGNQGYANWTFRGSEGQKNAGLFKYSSDGQVLWARLWCDGTRWVKPSAVTVDGDNHVYITGTTGRDDSGDEYANGNDIFLAKYDTDGNYFWTQTNGSSTASDRPQGVTTTSDGNIYVVGCTYGSFDGGTYRGGADAFIVGYSEDGSWLTSYMWGSMSDDFARGATSDGTDVYVCGGTKGSFDSDMVGDYSDFFVSKLVYTQENPQRYTLTLGNDITASPQPDGDGKYADGMCVTLTASRSGYAFTSWGGDLSGSSNPYDCLTMNANKSVTAGFTVNPQRYTLTLGSYITASPLPDGDGKYAAGTCVTLTASRSGYAFTSWGGDLSGSLNPYDCLPMNGNKSVSASFTVNPTPTPVLSVTPVNQSVSSAAGTTSFAVTNTGGGTLSYTTSEAEPWLSITAGGSGGNSGTITVEYVANSSLEPRSGTITIYAAGAGSSPQFVTVTQGRSMSGVLAWGYESFGQCAVPAEAQSGVSSIAAGFSHILGLKNGQILAWGDNSGGECTVPVEAQSGVSAIAAGNYFSVALKSGKVMVWGAENSNMNYAAPVEAQSGVSNISVSGYHVVALKNGKVLAWGWTSDGQCNVPAEAKSGVSAIAAGSWHTVALKNGKVLAWGYNDEGECTVPAEAQSGVSAIAAGRAHTVALKNGKVLAWGDNSYGQCSVPVEALSGVSAIAAGLWHTVALKNGKVLAWGLNDYGQCNVPADALSGISSIAANGYCTVAIDKGDGSSSSCFSLNQAINCAGPGWSRTFVMDLTNFRDLVAQDGYQSYTVNYLLYYNIWTGIYIYDYDGGGFSAVNWLTNLDL